MTNTRNIVGWRTWSFAALGVAAASLLASTTASRSEPTLALEVNRLACSIPAETTNSPLAPFSLVMTQPSPARTYAGFRTCLQCHSNGIAGQVELPGGIKLDLMKEQWVLYKEFPIWSKDDKHGQAYTVLLNERSKTIGKLIGVTEIHRDPRCLACHTGFPLAQIPLEKDGLADRDLTKNLDVNLGVSCEGCHGPASDQRIDNRVVAKGWKDAHQIQPMLPYEKTRPWRFLSPKEKLEEFGFYDVRTPSSKAKLCVSCHIGDVEQGRIVTHEMYAAGHPPLPGFEMETFIEQMPRHWAEFPAKAPEVQDLYLKFTADPFYSEKVYQKNSLHRTRALLAGSLMTAGQYLKYAGQLADDRVKSPVPRPEWPELAVFDCYACHHELKSPGWRRVRKPPVGTPGRPTLQDWPFTLARLALKPGEIDGKMIDVRRSLGMQPFGNAKEVATSTQAASTWFIAKSQEYDQRPVTKEDGVRLLTRIAQVAAEEIHDYDSARQLMWAFQVVSQDLRGEFPNAKAVNAALDPPAKSMFLLNLRTGRKSVTAVPGDKQERATVEVDLRTVMPFVANYDPAQFRDAFKAISALLR